MGYERESYHSYNSRPAWRNSNQLKGAYIGVELETVSRTRSYRDVLRRLPEFNARCRPLTEEDGSLPDNTGVEIIFPPFRASTIKKSTSVLAKSMAAIDGVVAHGHRATGMHINLNVGDMLLSERTCMMHAVHCLTSTMLANLGGRYPNNYCSPYPYASRGRTLPASDHYRGLCWHGNAAELHGSRLELRFPQSTTNHKRLKLLVDFCMALRAFAKSKYASDMNFSDTVQSCNVFLSYLYKMKRYRLVHLAITEGFEAYQKATDTSAGATAAAAIDQRPSTTTSVTGTCTAVAA